MASDLATLRTMTRRLLDETDNTNSSFSDTEINDYLNQAARKVASLLEWPLASYTATSVQSQAEYGLPSGLLYIIGVHFDGKPIAVVDRADLDGLYGQWQNADDGEPLVAYRTDNNALGIFHAPSLEFDAKTIEIHTVKLPTTLSADSDVPDLHDILQDTLPVRAAVFGMIRAGNYKAAAYLETLFDKEINAAKSKVNKFAEELESFRWV